MHVRRLDQARADLLEKNSESVKEEVQLLRERTVAESRILQAKVSQCEAMAARVAGALVLLRASVHQLAAHLAQALHLLQGAVDPWAEELAQGASQTARMQAELREHEVLLDQLRGEMERRKMESDRLRIELEERIAAERVGVELQGCRCEVEELREKVQQANVRCEQLRQESWRWQQRVHCTESDLVQLAVHAHAAHRWASSAPHASCIQAPERQVAPRGLFRRGTGVWLP